jgi:hypothetical protein
MQALTPKLLRKWLSFDDQTGFIWKKTRGRVIAGARAGTLRDNGQRIITLFGGHYTEQRLRYFWKNGTLPARRVRRRWQLDLDSLSDVQISDLISAAIDSDNNE